MMATTAPLPRALPLLGENHRLGTATPSPHLQGLDAVNQRLRRKWNTPKLHILRAEAEAITALAPEWRALDEKEFDRRMAGARDALRRAGRAGQSPDQRIPAVAALCELAWRTLGLRPYPEQIIGVLAIVRGCLAEMATGEGKTLCIGLAAVFHGWRGVPCHVITANDYLVARDAEWLAPFYRRAGLSVGTILGRMRASERAIGYAADITYATSKEVVADFLRDRLQLAQPSAPTEWWLDLVARGDAAARGLVQRGLNAAIIDEADHVLIDEAVTPLIISREKDSAEHTTAARVASRLAAALEPGTDYHVIRLWRDIELKSSAKEKLADLAAELPVFWRGERRREELLLTALRAREFYLRDQQYVIDGDGTIQLVDESTGRIMPHRTWQLGLHQAVQAKENLAPSPATETMARLSFQKYFRLYRHLSGLTGTAWEARGEFWDVYRLPVVRVPTHRPSRRHTESPRVFPDAAAKWDAVVERIRDFRRDHVPVLVGTRSVEDSEYLATRLTEAGIDCALLNAVRHDREASIITQAGEAGRVTIATNMAGRGTDILLGAGVENRGGLAVIGTEWHDSPRVDRQLSGRCARQGQPGRSLLCASLDDALPKRFLPAWLRRATARFLAGGGATANAIATLLLRFTQQRARAHAARQRRRILAHDHWLHQSLGGRH
jgi:preprotein translocase subunit SecA